MYLEYLTEDTFESSFPALITPLVDQFCLASVNNVSPPFLQLLQHRERAPGAAHVSPHILRQRRPRRSAPQLPRVLHHGNAVGSDPLDPRPHQTPDSGRRPTLRLAALLSRFLSFRRKIRDNRFRCSVSFVAEIDFLFPPLSLSTSLLCLSRRCFNFAERGSTIE